MANLVPTMLHDGDELGSFAGHIVERARNLSELYKLTPQAIVQANGVPHFTAADIDAWVLRTGGKRLPNGQAVFASTSVILLPPGGPRAPAPAPSGPSTAVVAGGGLVGLGLIGTALYFLFGKD